MNKFFVHIWKCQHPSTAENSFFITHLLAFQFFQFSFTWLFSVLMTKCKRIFFFKYLHTPRNWQGQLYEGYYTISCVQYMFSRKVLLEVFSAVQCCSMHVYNSDVFYVSKQKHVSSQPRSSHISTGKNLQIAVNY